ncbi:class I SAM-dependent methyltransferase [bacterium]|nr:class I SAM-dependent methyltransferase [bacterium]
MMTDMNDYSQRLTFLPEKIWAARGGDKISYPDNGNAVCNDIEMDSFWYMHRNQCISAMLGNYPPPGVLFDIGGGNGVVSVHLKQCGYTTIVVEPGRQGALNARARGIDTVVWATLEEAAFMTDSLPAAGMFDVLEHIENEKKLLTEIHRILRPGGRLYISVPAHKWLWSFNDEHLGHYRRYSLKQLSNVATSAGFITEYSTYFFSILPLPIWISRTLPSRMGYRQPITPATKRKEHVLNTGMIHSFITTFLERELKHIRNNKSVSIGASCLLVARKPGEIV